VKQHDHVANAMELDQVSALAPKLLRAKKIPPTRGERARAAGHVEPIVPRDVKMVREEMVGRLL
jgi:hypothetical protein